jgi:hypothetical protein
VLDEPRASEFSVGAPRTNTEAPKRPILASPDELSDEVIEAFGKAYTPKQASRLLLL